MKRWSGFAKQMLRGCMAGVLAMTVQGAGQEVAPQAGAQKAGAPMEGPLSIRTFYLRSVTPYTDANEIASALRNILDSRNRIILVPSQNAIVVEGPQDQIAAAEKLLGELDRPRKQYRLTYTISEVEDGKRVGVQHFSLEMVTGQRATLKQGSKVPIVTGSYDSGRSQAQTQVTYLDIGLNFDSTLDVSDTGLQLKSKVEQSSIAEEKSGVGPQDPVVRQSVLEGTSRVQAGKPLVIGALDLPGSTRHLAIEVLVEQEKP